MKASIITLSLVGSVSSTNGFLQSTGSASRGLHHLRTSGVPEEDDSASVAIDTVFDLQEIEEEEESRPSQFGKRMSEAIPFLECPKVLRQSTLAGNVGFDPLGLAQNQDQLTEYREAEIKHSRLAMLAAVGWPVSELTDRTIASYFNAPSTLDEGDRVPSVLNGGLERIDPRFWGFCLGMCAAIDLYGVSKSRRAADDYFPGNIGFDPLGLFPADRQGQERMKLAEIKHGRTAMTGVVGYVVEEYVTKMAVVDDTPVLFQPITETVEEALSTTLLI
ncbi:fucoxanthin chlorophyll a/c protein [Nitzschia inconspicua]|uniref:Fucoxanthin chlorophyll a/c protein n=1 Tax=Nitzschia inconspicua TaxID=303405 RepID=A0A9K3L1P2_9STRA|nr:fucoxanthin chlorophyll a/c protein [Nitzschia inconspicua]